MATSLAEAITEALEAQGQPKDKAPDPEPEGLTLSDEDLAALVEVLSQVDPDDLARLVEALAEKVEEPEPEGRGKGEKTISNAHPPKDPNAPKSLGEALARQYESLRGPAQRKRAS